MTTEQTHKPGLYLAQSGQHPMEQEQWVLYFDGANWHDFIEGCLADGLGPKVAILSGPHMPSDLLALTHVPALVEAARKAEKAMRLDGYESIPGALHAEVPSELRAALAPFAQPLSNPEQLPAQPVSPAYKLDDGRDARIAALESIAGGMIVTPNGCIMVPSAIEEFARAALAGKPDTDPHYARIAELEGALRRFIEWDDAERNARPYDEDAGRGFYSRTQMCREAFEAARAALAERSER